MSAIEKEVEKLPAILRRFVPPHIDSKALDRYALRKARERAETALDPEDETFLRGEWQFLYYVMLGDLPQRCHRVFRLYFVHKLELRAIARRLRITLRTARRDLERALTAIAREQSQVEREGVVAKGNDD
jgi:DNA-directed RNA polymerase specialized sigma24 family protein